MNHHKLFGLMVGTSLLLSSLLVFFAGLADAAPVPLVEGADGSTPGKIITRLPEAASGQRAIPVEAEAELVVSAVVPPKIPLLLSSSDITVTKTANPTSVPETGGNVTFTIQVTNNSTETATLKSLSDDVFGNLNGKGSCNLTVPQTLPYSCLFTEFVSGNFGDVYHENTVTAEVSDNEGNSVFQTATEQVAFTDVQSSIAVSKTANPTSVPESGGIVNYTVLVTNDSIADEVTITGLSDIPFGNVGTNCLPALPAVLAIGESTTCTFSRFISGQPSTPHTNTVDVIGNDDDNVPVSGNDSATVTFNNQTSSIRVDVNAAPSTVPETGGTVNFTVRIINNSSVDSVTIHNLTDSLFGNLDGEGNCSVPWIIPPGGNDECTFSDFIFGDAGGALVEETVTASGLDDDNQSVGDTDTVFINFSDVSPNISISKTADPTSVPETGGDVTFTIQVTNNTAEPNISLTSLTDSDFGNLDGQGNCDVPRTLAGNGSYSCSFTKFIAGDYGGPDHQNTATAHASDDEGGSNSDQDSTSVGFNNVLPDISVTNTPNPAAVTEPGGNVTFNILVTNNSAEAATLTWLSNNPFDLTGTDCDLTQPQALAANGGTYSCAFTQLITGNFGDSPHQNTVEAQASDDDGGSDTKQATATVPFAELFETYLPIILKPGTILSVFNDNTGGNVFFEVLGTGVSCTVPNNATQLCGTFLPGTYNVRVTSVCGPPATFVKTYSNGPQTTRVFCN